MVGYRVSGLGYGSFCDIYAFSEMYILIAYRNLVWIKLGTDVVIVDFVL